MRALFSFFADQRAGILMFLLTLIVLTGVAQWVLWILGRGRFRYQSSSGVFRELITKIIYEFRHLLALAIVLLFSVALFFAIWPGVMGEASKIFERDFRRLQRHWAGSSAPSSVTTSASPLPGRAVVQPVLEHPRLKNLPETLRRKVL